MGVHGPWRRDTLRGVCNSSLQLETEARGSSPSLWLETAARHSKSRLQLELALETPNRVRNVSWRLEAASRDANSRLQLEIATRDWTPRYCSAQRARPAAAAENLGSETGHRDRTLD